ncbi:MAG: hypothetical protein FJ149_12840 [Euryarchaeota archaeon]|nr:hypothetical protein [Euryarchaeota archaeon]
METRNCPRCGRPMSFIPARNGHFCSVCRQAPEDLTPAVPQGPAGAPGAPAGAVPAATPELPPELIGALPASPPSEVTLYVPTSDPKPIVRRSSLRRGTVEALSEQETRQAVQTGDFIILSKPGRCALVAARKALGEPSIEPLALEMAGEPWRLRISAPGGSVEAGLFRPRPAAPSRLAPPGSPPPEEFHVAYLALRGPPEKLSEFVSAMLGLLGEPPWSSRFWDGMSRVLNQPQSKLMLDWKQYADYSLARSAATELAAAHLAFREAQRDGLTSPEAQNALERARSELARGEYESVRQAARRAGGELETARKEKRLLEAARGRARAAITRIRARDPSSREAARLDEQLTAVAAGAPAALAQARDRMEALQRSAADQLFAIHAAAANKLLSGISEEDDTLVSEIRKRLEGELSAARKLLGEGEMDRADESLAGACAAASKSIDGYFAEHARAAAEELDAQLEESRENPALGADFLVRLDRGRREMDAHLQAGRNREAGELARAFQKELGDRLESSAPVIRLAIDGPRLTAETWNKVVMKVENSGNSDAANVVIAIDGPVELRARDELPLLRAGETYRDEIGIKCDENGAIPVRLLVDCERPHDSVPFHFEAELWLDFQRPLDLSGAKTITIDRSVHIVDSVLNRSTVGEEGAGGERPQPAAVERKCQGCGRMISTGWKRCPYCN